MPDYWSSTKLRLRVESNDGGEEVLDLDRPYGILGSGKDCDVRIESVAKHAILIFEIDGVTRALVLAARSKQAGRSFRVVPNQPVPLGDCRVSVLCDSTPEPLDEHAKTSDDESTVYAITWKSDQLRQFLNLREAKPVLIGRKAPCHILIGDQRLSGQHGALFRRGERLWFIDLHSANGTTVGNEPVTCTSLAPDKSLVLGASQRVHFVRFHTDETLQAKEALQESQQAKLGELETELQASGLLVTKLTEVTTEFDAIRRSLESQVEQTQENCRKLSVELQQRQQELEEHSQGEEAQRQAALEAERQLETAHQTIEALRQDREQLQQQLSKLQEELVAARNLVDSDTIRERESELESLQEELKAEREILNHLQLQVKSTGENEAAPVSEDETCISSFDFQDMLEEAWEGLPSIEEE